MKRRSILGGTIGAMALMCTLSTPAFATAPAGISAAVPTATSASAPAFVADVPTPGQAAAGATKIYPSDAAPAPGSFVAAAEGKCNYSGRHDTLRSGSSGAQVVHAQCLLRNYHGFTSLAVDGQFGSSTKNAVIAVQRRNGLTQDGVIGPQTWDALHPD